MAFQRVLILTAALLGVAALGARADERGGGGFGQQAARPMQQAARPMRQLARPQSRPMRSPLVIHMGHMGGSGSRNQNFPAQQRPASSAPARPSWGHVTWSSPSSRPGASARPASAWSPRPAAGSIPRSAAGTRIAAVQHHHPYTLGYVRGKLRKLGVSAEPSLITDRSEMIHTDRRHSSISYPARGPQGAALNAHLINPGGADARARMGRVNDPGWRSNVESYNRIENRSGHYYWHTDGDSNYCHYLDASGYQWYGWYQGDSFFWTRDFDGRWWWYDASNDRWTFYNDNFWWWQDPNHVGDLYCYNDGAYIPANSAEDQIVVSQPDTGDMQSFVSPDGTRVVKLVAGGEDAFLYDTATPPSFDPIYLASGVQSVQFSDSGTVRPLEIVLKLDDGSFDLFDDEGRAYGPGEYDGDAAASQDAPAPAPQDGGAQDAPAGPQDGGAQGDPNMGD